jgi:hypothetical protein
MQHLPDCQRNGRRGMSPPSDCGRPGSPGEILVLPRSGLARVAWAEQCERQKGHDLLAPVYGWFPEGFDTAVLKEPKALFDELG